MQANRLRVREKRKQEWEKSGGWSSRPAVPDPHLDRAYLTGLFLPGNTLGHVQVQRLAKALSTPGCGLAVLELSDTRLSSTAARVLGQALCSPAQQPDPDADPDPDSRPRASNMQERLEQAEADEVEVGRPLEVLGLARNSLGESGASHLSEVLGYNRSLQTLNLAYNHIPPSGITALADSLHHNNTLTELDVRGNMGGDKGADALAYMLRENAGLRSLNISCNGVGRVGVDALRSALRVAPAAFPPTLSASRMPLSEAIGDAYPIVCGALDSARDPAGENAWRAARLALLRGDPTSRTVVVGLERAELVGGFKEDVGVQAARRLGPLTYAALL